MKRVDRFLGRVRRVRHKWLWVTFGVLWVWAATRPPAMVGIERLIDPGHMRVIQVDMQFSLIEYGCKWLVEIDDPAAVDELMEQGRLQWGNLAHGPRLFEGAREYSPNRFKSCFSDESEFLGMCFKHKKGEPPLFVDIVVSVDRKLVYFHVWDT